MSDTPQKTNPHNIVATVEETQKMTLNTSKTKHFANTICVLVTGIVLKFLKVSLSLSIKNMEAVTAYRNRLLTAKEHRMLLFLLHTYLVPHLNSK